jgi:enoyl-CoA hydratase
MMTRAVRTDVVLVERAGPVLTITLNRPDAHNALDARVLAAIGDALGQAGAARDGLRVVVLAAAGETSFCAGADLHELDALDAEAAAAHLEAGARVFGQLDAFPVPVVAKVHGRALGGGFELALAADLVVGSTTASFGLPETRLGLVPGYGGTQRLPAAVGRGPALHAMLTGEPLSADRAYALGLLAVPPVPPGELDAALDALVQRLLAAGPAAAAAVLRLTSGGAGFADETAAAAEAVASREGAEGIAAFRARRAPAWAGARP